MERKHKDIQNTRKTQIRTEITKAKIINAAKKIFIKNGYSGTSISQIVETAKINKSLIFHHFINKKNLWIEVKLSIVEKSKQKSTIPSLDLSWSNFVSNSIKNLIYFYKNNPDIVALINWQRIEKNTISVGSSKTSLKWIEAINHYKKTRQINQELSTEFILCMILSISSSLGIDNIAILKEEKKLNNYIDFVTDSIVQTTTQTNT